MGTDPEPTMKNKADQQLVEIDKKYSGFIHVSGSLVYYHQKSCESANKIVCFNSIRGQRCVYFVMAGEFYTISATLNTECYGEGKPGFTLKFNVAHCIMRIFNGRSERLKT